MSRLYGRTYDVYSVSKYFQENYNKKYVRDNTKINQINQAKQTCSNIRDQRRLRRSQKKIKPRKHVSSGTNPQNHKKRSIENPNQPSKAVLQHNSLATKQCLYHLLRQTRVRKLRLRQYQSRIRWSFLRELHAFP